MNGEEHISSPFLFYFPETVIPPKAAQGSTVNPSATISREIAHYILQHIRKIAGNHSFAHRIGDFSVLYEKAVLRHSGKISVGAGLSTGETSHQNAFVNGRNDLLKRPIS